MLDFLDLMRQGLILLGASILSGLYFTRRAFNPAQRSGEIKRHEINLVLIHEASGIAYIFLIANFLIVGVLVNG